MTDTTQILQAIEKMNTSTNISFSKVYAKIDEKFDDCDGRLIEVETKLAIKEALCKQKKEQQGLSRDYWQTIIRAVSIAGILALLGIAIKLILFGIKL